MKNNATLLKCSVGSDGRMHLALIGELWEGSAAQLVDAIDAAAAGMSEPGEVIMEIHSPGGNVIDGWRIAHRIQQLRASGHKVTAEVTGWALSMASVIAAQADEVNIVENGWMMIHDPWTVAIGNADDLVEQAERLDVMASQIAASYAGKAGGDADDWRALMRAETWYTGAEAVEAGLANRMLEPMKVAAHVLPGTLKNAPAAFVAEIETAEETFEENEDEDDDTEAPDEQGETPPDPAEDEEDDAQGEPAAAADIVALVGAQAARIAELEREVGSFDSRLIAKLASLGFDETREAQVPGRPPEKTKREQWLAMSDPKEARAFYYAHHKEIDAGK
jgi:ATP-dependent protease ClpP protease subunit